MELPCPLPEVAEALQPYIKSRQEVDEIRQAVRNQLPLTAVNALAGVSISDKDATSLPSVQKAYWKALQAHRSAQSKYQALRRKVEELTTAQVPGNGIHDQDSSFLKESYLPLLRQREKQRKLATLDHAFNRIHSIGRDVVAESFDSVVRKEIGDLPNPPSASTFPERDLDSFEGPDLTVLKQAILSTKKKIEAHERSSVEIESLPEDVNPHAELQALQDAHNELTIWMEGQLGLISDVDPTAENGDSPVDAPAEVATPKPGEDIESLYEQYLDGRERLLEIVLHPNSSGLSSFEKFSTQKREVDNNKDAESRIPADAVIPYLSALVAAKQQDQSLLQQSAFTRRQLAAGEHDVQAALSRLADESHLVPPSLSSKSTSGKDWLNAAIETSRSTREFALERLQAGQVSAELAAQAMAGIKGLPKSLDALLE